MGWYIGDQIILYNVLMSPNQVTDLLLAGLFCLPRLSLLLGGRHLNHFLFLVDPVLPVLFTTLLQQCHSDIKQKKKVKVIWWENLLFIAPLINTVSQPLQTFAWTHWTSNKILYVGLNLRKMKTRMEHDWIFHSASVMNWKDVIQNNCGTQWKYILYFIAFPPDISTTVYDHPEMSSVLVISNKIK